MTPVSVTTKRDATITRPHEVGLPISPLQLDQLTRDVWGSFDPLAIALLAPLAQQKCYQPKFYKAPLSSQELVPANGFVTQALQITAGSIFYGIYLPTVLLNFQAPLWNVMITDKSSTEDYDLFDQPLPAFFIANARVTYQSALAFPSTGQIGSSPYLLAQPYPITGKGLLLMQFWETSGFQQRIECVLGCLELIG